MKTTIQISHETAKRLQEHKYSERQSYDEVINRVLNEVEDDTLTSQDIEEIQEALEEVKNKKTISIEELSKKLGVEL